MTKWHDEHLRASSILLLPIDRNTLALLGHLYKLRGNVATEDGVVLGDAFEFRRRRSNRWPTSVASWLIVIGTCITVGSPALAQDSSLHVAATSLPAWAQARGNVPRRALVVGVANYDYLPTLPRSDNDSAVIVNKLRELDFDVIVPSARPTRAVILDAFDAFSSTLNEGDIALVYFSGHGVERNGANYLIPADTRELASGREGLQAVGIEFIMSELQARKVSAAIIILDACRQDPFVAEGPGTPVQAKGLAPINADSSGLFVGYAAAPRETAFGGLSGDPLDSPSVFTRYLAEHLTKPSLSLYRVWSDVGLKVYEVTGHRQRPWQSASLFPEIKLKALAADHAEAEAAWREMLALARVVSLQGDLEQYVRVFPDSPYAPAAWKKLRELRSNPRPEVRTGQSAQAAAQLTTIEFFGAVVPLSVAATEEDLNRVAATTDLVVRTQPRGDSMAVTSVTAGTHLEALGAPNAAGWVPVKVSGTQLSGFISAVSAVTVPTTSPTAPLHYAPRSTALGPENLVRLRAVLEGADLPNARVNLEVGRPSGVAADRALTLAYLRALKLRSKLVNEGLQPDQVRVLIGGASKARSDAVDLHIVPANPGDHQ